MRDICPSPLPLRASQSSELSKSLLHALEESLGAFKKHRERFSISGYADRPSKGDHPRAPARLAGCDGPGT